MKQTGENSKKEKRKKVAFSLLFLVIFGICFVIAARLVERKDSRAKNSDYFDVAEQVDVLLLGSSHMINGINPAILYEEYGIASYNLGGHGNTMQVTYWELMNALDYGTPQYVVIDTYLLEEDYQYIDLQTEDSTDEEKDAAVDQLHEVLDVFPLSRTKIAAIRDLLSSPSLRAEFVFDFIRYHSRWSELDVDDYAGVFGEPESSAILGAQMRYEVETNISLYGSIDSSEKMEVETVGKAYLRRIIETCLNHGIYPMIVQIPFSESEELQAIANSAQDIADEYGITFINMNYVDDIIDPETDQQSQTHLNVAGAAKASSYLGNILSEVVGVPDRRGQEGYEAWDEAVEEYHDEIVEMILQPTDLYVELLALEFNEVSAIIFINNDSVAFYDPTLQLLIEKLSGTMGITTMANSNLAYCLIYDPGMDQIEETMGDVRFENIETSFGVVNFTSLEDYALLSVGDDITVNELDYLNNTDIDVQILLYDPETGEEIGHLYFDDAGIVQE